MIDVYPSDESGANFVGSEAWDYRVLYSEPPPLVINLRDSSAAGGQPPASAETPYSGPSEGVVSRALGVLEDAEDLARVAVRRVRGSRFRPYREFREEQGG
jgi:hypothetical protein